jgi:hypothetical protein
MPARASSLRRPGAGALLAGLWLAAVVVIAILRTATGEPRPGPLACSPAALAAGKVWTLASSALIVDGPPIAQVIITAAVLAAVMSLLGTRAFWWSALTAHIGSTLLAYAGIGLLWLVARHDVRAVVHAPDYGISAIWAGALGALSTWAVTRAAHHRSAARRAVLGSLLVFVVLVPLDGELADVEHLIAYLLGAAVAVPFVRPLGWTPRRLPVLGRPNRRLSSS